MGFWKELWDLLLNKKRPQRVAYPLSDEQIKESQLFKDIVKKLRTVEGQLGRELSEKAKKTEFEKKDWEEELKKSLKEKEQEIRRKKYQRSVSFFKVFNDLSKEKKLKNKIEVVDREDKKVFGIFKDLIALDGGKLAITIKGEKKAGKVVSIGRTLHEIIYKPDSLHNQLRRKKIMIPYDENGKYVPDTENIQMHDVMEMEDGRYAQASEKVFFVKELLIKRDEENKNLRATIERQEALIVDLNAKLRDSSRANRVLQRDSDISETQLSETTNKLIKIQTNFMNMSNRLINLQEQFAYNEKALRSVEEQRVALLEKAQELGIKGDLEIALDHVKDVIEFAKANTPETVYIQPEKEEKPQRPIFPGQKIPSNA